MDFVTAVRTKIVRDRAYRFVSARGADYPIQLVADGQVKGSEDFTHWEARLKKERATLFLYNRGALFAVLFLESHGTFEGRERDGGTGTHLVLPSLVAVDEWKAYFNPRGWKTDESGEYDFEIKETLSPQLDWSRFDYNLADHVEKKYVPSGNTAVALIAYDRPAYFRRMVEALSMNPEMTSLPVF